LAQEKNVESISENYKDYTGNYREVVYLHLNKSFYIEGEDLAYTAYVFDKAKKILSSDTKNLYVSIEDESKNVLIEKLIKAENGVSSNVVAIDSSFTRGNYTIKAYTNWMLNFDEENHFIESFKVVDPYSSETEYSPKSNVNIDAQFLPESGHILASTSNNIGVIIKDKKGYGIPNVKGKVYDKNEIFITEFQVNHLGIGKFLLLAETSNNYKVKIQHLNEEYDYVIPHKVQPYGVNLSINFLKGKALANITTNNESLDMLKDKDYKLVLHNGKNIDMIDLVFDKETEIIKTFDLSTLTSGIQMLTLFNENLEPVAERMFFNYNNIDIINANNIEAKTVNDSIIFNLSYDNLNTKQFSNLSVSVLPEKTISYQRHHNILSYIFLKPYLRESVENAKYYFTDIDKKKKLALDNLLLTQGWSSYDWSHLFKKEKTSLLYDFEEGISVKVNVDSKYLNKNNSDYFLHYLNGEEIEVSELSEDSESFMITELYPNNNSTLNLTKTNRKGKLRKVPSYLQFFPYKIPDYHISNQNILKPKHKTPNISKVNSTQNNFLRNLDKKQTLDEVLVKANPGVLKKLEENKLSMARHGRVYVFDENDERSFITLTNFLKYKLLNFRNVDPNNIYGNIGDINNPNSFTFFFNDDKLFPGTVTEALLDPLFIEDVTHIEINRFGVGEGLRAPGGFAKIYSRKIPKGLLERQNFTEHEFPLTYNKGKTFYVPKYKYYNDDFYEKYGVIDWKPNLKLNEDGKIYFKIAETQVPFKLIIEGVTEDGSFISDIVNFQP
jgi:hypothetical protein